MRRGSVVLIVMWAVAIAAIVLSSVQLFGYRQSMIGGEALHRVQARWAARGGVEWAISILADHTEYPVPEDAFALPRDLAHYARQQYELGGSIIAEYDIRHETDGRTWWGPMDEHSKVNINLVPDNPAVLTNLSDMSPDIVDSIMDWIDADDDIRPLGAEREYYLSLPAPYEPRNGPLQGIAELELVAGIWPDHLRGEDWNLNGRLDSNENDGDETWPMDEPDERLDGAWSSLFTARSAQGKNGVSGQPQIHLATADPVVLAERLGLTEEQAGALVNFGKNQTNKLEQLLTRYATQQTGPAEEQAPAETRGQRGALRTTAQQSSQLVLSEEQLRAVLAETTMDDPKVRRPGKLNINTASFQVLQALLPGKEYLADEIVFLRNSRPEGITSMVDLLQVPAFQQDTAALEFVAGLMDTRSYVYTVASRGRSSGGGVEVEIIAVVDRSTLPVRILEYREE